MKHYRFKSYYYYKNKKGKKHGILRIPFVVVCIFMTIYMSSIQLKRYFDNEDTSSSHKKEFNQSPNDLYPSFTYCFEDNEGGIYDEKITPQITGMNRSHYQKVLTGQISSFSSESSQNILSISDIDTDNVTLTLNNVILYMDSHFFNNSKHQVKKFGKVHDTLPFYKSYEDPVKICFTRKSLFEKGIVREYEYVYLKDAKTLVSLFNRKTEISLYIHQDYHLTRAFNNLPVYSYRLKKGAWPLIPLDIFLDLNIVIVSMLRERFDGKQPCNPSLINDDKEFRNRAMEIIGCIPPYWKQFESEISSLKQCNTSKELKTAFDQIKRIDQIMDTYMPPCNEMSIVTTLHVRQNWGSGLNTKYMVKDYEETVHRRDFGHEMFWSGFGGFTGMFLGFSLLNILDFVLQLMGRLYRSRNK